MSKNPVTDNSSIAQQLAAGGVDVEQSTDSLWTLSCNGVQVTFWPRSQRCWAYGRSFTPKSIDALINALQAGRIRPSPGDAAYRPGVCLSCNERILWYTPPPKQFDEPVPRRPPVPHPVNLTGLSHFSTCPAAAEHRKKPASKRVKQPSKQESLL